MDFHDSRIRLSLHLLLLDVHLVIAVVLVALSSAILLLLITSLHGRGLFLLVLVILVCGWLHSVCSVGFLLCLLLTYHARVPIQLLLHVLVLVLLLGCRRIISIGHRCSLAHLLVLLRILHNLLINLLETCRSIWLLLPLVLRIRRTPLLRLFMYLMNTLLVHEVASYRILRQSGCTHMQDRRHSLRVLLCATAIDLMLWFRLLRSLDFNLLVCTITIALRLIIYGDTFYRRIIGSGENLVVNEMLTLKESF